MDPREGDSPGKNPVRVVVRVRECNQVSSAFSVDSDTTVTLKQSVVELTGNTSEKSEKLAFSCDKVLQNASQERTFEVAGKPAIDAALAGYNGTVLAYGQTGAGKSFTMVGSSKSYNQRGIAPRAIAHAFREAANRPQDEFTFRLSCLEIYNDTMYDLLSTLPSEVTARPELSLAEVRGKVEVKGLLSPEVESEEAALQMLFEAESNRAVAQHQLNQLSSRSHVLYVLHIEKRSKLVPNGAVVTSRLTLGDLAGSERLKKSSAFPATAASATGGGGGGGGGGAPPAAQLAREAMAINKSLSFLEQVVIALAKKSGHVPHRSSKLTAVLRESLGGNCKTFLVANVWPEGRHLEETLSTLKFAARMASVTNTAAINSHAEISPQQALAMCQAQLHELKRELAMHDQLAGRGHVTYEPSTPAQKSALKAKVVGYLAGEVPELEPTTMRQMKETLELMRALYAEQGAQLKDAEARAARAASAGSAHAAAAAAASSSVSVHAEVDDPGQVPVEVVELVGEVEGGGGASGFACGVAPADARPSDPQFAVETPRAGAAPALASKALTPRPSKEAPYGMGGGAASAHSAPPEGFFSEFKQTAGAELHAQLLQNKATLRARKAAQRRCAVEVNASKAEIDDLKAEIEQKKLARADRPPVSLPQGGGAAADVIDDEEFALLSRLKQAKARYRSAFDALTDERSTAEYVATTVEQCRGQLLADFATWMSSEHPEAAESAAAIAAATSAAADLGQPSATSSLLTGLQASSLGGGGGLSSIMGGGGGGSFGGGAADGRASTADVLDQDEVFENLESQLALAQDPDSLAFFKASKLATARSTKKDSIRSKPRPFQ